MFINKKTSNWWLVFPNSIIEMGRMNNIKEFKQIQLQRIEIMRKFAVFRTTSFTSCNSFWYFCFCMNECSGILQLITWSSPFSTFTDFALALNSIIKNHLKLRVKFWGWKNSLKLKSNLINKVKHLSRLLLKFKTFRC